MTYKPNVMLKHRLLVACLNTPTLPYHAHPRDFNENKLIV